jgi:hypothetical protein
MRVGGSSSTAPRTLVPFCPAKGSASSPSWLLHSTSPLHSPTGSVSLSFDRDLDPWPCKREPMTPSPREGTYTHASRGREPTAEGPKYPDAGRPHRPQGTSHRESRADDSLWIGRRGGVAVEGRLGNGRFGAGLSIDDRRRPRPRQHARMLKRVRRYASRASEVSSSRSRGSCCSCFCCCCFCCCWFCCCRAPEVDDRDIIAPTGLPSRPPCLRAS